MITLVLADASIELIPSRLHGHPSVRSYCRKYSKKPSETLLDSTYHHNAMTKLENGKKRGRPDIVHLCLLAALGSPLNLSGRLRTLVHTRKDELIEVRSDTRLPRNYDRFKGLIEKLFVDGQVGQDLLRLEQNVSFSQICSRWTLERVLALDRGGDPLAGLEPGGAEVGIIVGAFPSGDWRETYTRSLDSSISVHSADVDAWIAVNRVLGHFETI